MLFIAVMDMRRTQVARFSIFNRRKGGVGGSGYGGVCGWCREVFLRQERLRKMYVRMILKVSQIFTWFSFPLQGWSFWKRRSMLNAQRPLFLVAKRG